MQKLGLIGCLSTRMKTDFYCFAGVARMVVEWVMEKATIPVITKLTPNVHSVVPTGKAVVEAGTNALSLINTIQSVTGVDLDRLVPNPYVAGKSVFWGYCGPAVKPIALKFLTTIAQDPVTNNPTVATVATMEVFPASRNIIEEEVVFTIDLRDIDLPRRNLYEQQLYTEIKNICNKQVSLIP